MLSAGDADGTTDTADGVRAGRQAGSGHVAVSLGHLPVLDEQSGEREDVQQPLHLGACEQRREQQALHAFLDQIPDHLARVTA